MKWCSLQTNNLSCKTDTFIFLYGKDMQNYFPFLGTFYSIIFLIVNFVVGKWKCWLMSLINDYVKEKNNLTKNLTIGTITAKQIIQSLNFSKWDYNKKLQKSFGHFSETEVQLKT